MSDTMDQSAREYLKSTLARIERLEEDKKALQADMKAVYDEAKSFGLDTKIIRKVVSIRKMDREKRQEEEAVLDLYLSAIGDR